MIIERITDTEIWYTPTTERNEKVAMCNIKKLLVLVLLLCLTMGWAGMERQKIEVYKLNDLGVYEEIKEIIKLKKVSVVKDILHNVDWEKKKVDMTREADYQFIFQFMNPDIEAKAISYSVWIGPNKDTIEVVKGDDQYVHLSKEDSSMLFEAITENNLTNLEHKMARSHLFFTSEL